MSDVVNEAFDRLHAKKDREPLSAAEEVLYMFLGSDAFRQLVNAGVPEQSKEHRDAVRAMQEYLAWSYLDADAS